MTPEWVSGRLPRQFSVLVVWEDGLLSEPPFLLSLCRSQRAHGLLWVRAVGHHRRGPNTILGANVLAMRVTGHLGRMGLLLLAQK